MYKYASELRADELVTSVKPLCPGLSQGLIIWTLLSRRLAVATTTKPNLGHLAPASEVVGKHTLPFKKGHGLPILKWYGMFSCGL
jgi:hypothetical protein